MTEQNKDQNDQSKVEQTPEERIQELTDMLKRNQAELENYRKRMEKNQSDMIKFSSEKIITKLIPILDNFTLAMMHTENKDECINGVKMIHKQLESFAQENGVTSPELLNKPFDSRFAQAIQVVTDTKKKDGVVVTQLTPAYLLHDKVIKHATVIVNKLQTTEKQENE